MRASRCKQLPVDSNKPTDNITEPPCKKPRRLLREACTEAIDENRCSICYEQYSEGAINEDGCDWIKCACSRWLHEECAEDCVIDANGEERFATIALIFFSRLPLYCIVCAFSPIIFVM